MTKVQLILVDGMRPDALALCKNPYIAQLLENSLVALNAHTVMPSVTLPCHMSLFHSVDPTRHGITTNTFMPQVRPINGLCEQLKATKKCGIFYNWEQLKDLAQPGSLAVSGFFAGRVFGYEEANQLVTEASINAMQRFDLDFTFTYLGWTDEAGHAHGWMGEEYLLEEICENAGELFDDEGQVLPKDVLYWIGYLYRYWHYYADESSAKIYKQAPVKTMIQNYTIFHTMDPVLAIENLKEIYNQKP